MDDDDRVVVEQGVAEELIFEGDDEDMDEGVKGDGEAEEEEEDTLLQMTAGNELEELEDKPKEKSEEQKDLEDGEVSEPEQEKKKPSGNLRVHLPDLLQGIQGADEFPMTQETIEKLDKRAKRFNTRNPIPVQEVGKVYDSLGIPLLEREKRSTGRYRLEFIQMHGVFSLSDEDIHEYFEQYNPEEVLDLSDDTCIVKFQNGLSSLRAMMELSKPIGEPKKAERIIKHVLTADSDDETERKVITRETKEELDKLVHPDDIPIEIPEGKWRLGKHHKKCEAILLRFARRDDFKPAHYLANDKYRPRTLPTEFAPPAEALEQEQLIKQKNKNFNKKNPWGDIAEEWSGPKKSREYEIPIESLDHPPRRFAGGVRDWDNPEDPDHPAQIRPGQSRKRKILERLDFDGREETGETKTYFSEGEVDSLEEEEENGVNFNRKLKKPRMGMVADMEEKKTQKTQKFDIRSRISGQRQKAASGGGMLKRKVDNSRFVVREEIIEEYLSDSEDTDAELAREANNLDLRHSLTMKIDNKQLTNRPILKAKKSFSERFEGGKGGDMSDLENDSGDDLGDIENMKIEFRQFSSSEDMDEDEEEKEEIKRELRRRKEARRQRELRDKEKGKEVDLRSTMRRKSESRRSDESRRRGSDEHRRSSSDLRKTSDGLRKSSDSLRKSSSDTRAPAGDLRARMSNKKKRVVEEEEEEDDDEEMEEEEEVPHKEVRVKKEKESAADKKESEMRRRLEKKKNAESAKEDEKKLIEERKAEIENLKKEEKALLEQKERKLREMQQKREEEKLREKKRERERREREKEKERQREKEQRERERLRAKEKLREKERSRRSRKKAESSSDESSDSEEDESSSESDESSSSDSSSDDSSSDSESSDSSESESETEKRRSKHSSSSKKQSEKKKEPEKKKSSKQESSKSSKTESKSSKTDSKSSKSSSHKDSKSSKSSKGDDSKKATELKEKLKNYLNKAKAAKEEKKDKK